jgi:hypothetical protein
VPYDAASLFKQNLLQQLVADEFAIFPALFAYLLSLLFSAYNLVSNRVFLCDEAVHGRVVLILDGETNIPILGIILGLL